MAMDLQTANQRALLIAEQTVEGTGEVLAPATDGVIVLNGQFRMQTDELERQIDKAGHGARPHVNVKRRCSYTGGIELRGANTVGDAAPIGTILRACGFQEALTPATSAIYSLITSGFEFFTLGGYDSGSLVSGIDARGALTRISMDIRNFAQAEFNILALPGVTPISDAAVADPTLTAFQSPVPIETESFEVDIGGTKLNAISLNVDTNAQVEIYEGSEKRFVYLRQLYAPSGTLRVFKEQRATFHPENVALAHTLQDVYAEIVGGGETFRLDLDSVQLGMATPVDQDGLSGWDIPFKTIGSSKTNALAMSFLTAP